MKPTNEDDFPSVKEIYNGIDIDSNITYIGEDRKITHKSYGSGYYPIEKFVEEVIATAEPAFEYRWIKGGAKLYAGNLAKSFQLVSYFLGLYNEKMLYSENVELFFQCCKDNKIRFYTLRCKPKDEIPELGKPAAIVFNDLIESIRTHAKSKTFKKKVYTRTHNCLRNFDGAKYYLDTLFSKYSKMLVMRIDLGFRNYDPHRISEITLKEAQDHFQRFLNNIRSAEIYKNQVGYIWKLESGKEKGYHYHLMIFYNGSLSIKDSYIANQIGRFWEKITEGAGTFHNCNANKEDYKFLGIGMVSHLDHEKLRNLCKALLYLFKKDQFLSERFKLRTRVYGRGKMPEISGLGRPRRKKNSE